MKPCKDCQLFLCCISNPAQSHQEARGLRHCGRRRSQNAWRSVRDMVRWPKQECGFVFQFLKLHECADQRTLPASSWRTSCRRSRQLLQCRKGATMSELLVIQVLEDFSSSDADLKEALRNSAHRVVTCSKRLLPRSCLTGQGPILR